MHQNLWEFLVFGRSMSFLILPQAWRNLICAVFHGATPNAVLCNETVPKQLKTSVGRMSVISRKEFEDILTQKVFPLSRPRQEDCGLNYGVVCCGSAGQPGSPLKLLKCGCPSQLNILQHGDMYQILSVWQWVMDRALHVLAPPLNLFWLFWRFFHW